MQYTALITKEMPEKIRHKLNTQFDLIYKPKIARKQILPLLKEVDVLITSGTLINEELISAAPLLKMVSNVSSGYDNFDITAMAQNQIIGTHTPNVLNDSVVDLTFGLMISAARKIPKLQQIVKTGGWIIKDDPAYFGQMVFGKKLGIIGLGRIGETLAKRAQAGFHMEVSYFNRSKKAYLEQQNIHWKPLDELCRTADFIVLMAPLTAETKNLISHQFFDLMKESAIFINVSRGAIVNEQALYEALLHNKIYAAASDVYAQEPVPPSHPLLQFDQFICTPHIGSAIETIRLEMAETAIQNVIQNLLHNKPQNIVTELRNIYKL